MTMPTSKHARPDADADHGEPAPKRLRSAADDGEKLAEGASVQATHEDAADELMDEEADEQAYHEQEDDTRPSNLYLDTIIRHALDFDFEKLCSVTLSHSNVYACLVDGKYFQGRGKSSPAYAHSISDDHHVFINLSTLKVYVLPEGYEVDDASLEDIKYLLSPSFTPQLLSSLDTSLEPRYDLARQPYLPGFIGLNNIKHTSYMNVVLHCLLHVRPLRDFFILNPAASSPESTELVKRFSMLCRKVWNPRAFKAQVSPHEFLQECANASNKRFKVTEAGDPLEFMSWLLNRLHRDLGGSRKARSSIIYKAFQGEVRVDDQEVVATGEFGSGQRFDLGRELKSTVSPFLFLSIDLPPTPLFQDALEENSIPQVAIADVLAKYDGETAREEKNRLRRYKINRLPPFLILHIKRFNKNSFVEEKNPTIVNFPLRGLDMRTYVEPQPVGPVLYDLVANVTHSSAAGTARDETIWRAQTHLRPPRDDKAQLAEGLTEDDEKWYQFQDLIVEEIKRGMVPLGESYIQVWERRPAAAPAVVQNGK